MAMADTLLTVETTVTQIGSDAAAPEIVTYELVKSFLPGEDLTPTTYTLRISAYGNQAPTRTETLEVADSAVASLFAARPSQKGTLSPLSATSSSTNPRETSSITTSASLSDSNEASLSTASSLTPAPIPDQPLSTDSTAGSATDLPAASTSSSLPSATTVSSHRDNGPSVGAIAGIAVGCFIAGLLAAALVAFALLSRKRRRHGQYDRAAAYEMKEHSPLDPDTPISKGPSVAVAALAPTSAAAVVEDALPRPADENTLRSALGSLRTQINNHVLSFYRSNPSQEQVPIDILATVLEGSGSPAENIQALLRDHRTRAAAMRFIIAWAVTSRMDGSGGQPSTFLPDEVNSFRDLISSNESDDQARGAFLSKWRTITAYLHSPDVDQSDDSQTRKVNEAVSSVDAALSTYAKGDTSERLRNLEEIMRRAERLAFMLFAQPGEFRFDWERAEQGIVVFPGLVQTSDDSGRALGSEKLIMERDVVRV